MTASEIPGVYVLDASCEPPRPSPNVGSKCAALLQALVRQGWVVTLVHPDLDEDSVLDCWRASLRKPGCEEHAAIAIGATLYEAVRGLQPDPDQRWSSAPADRLVGHTIVGIRTLHGSQLALELDDGSLVAAHPVNGSLSSATLLPGEPDALDWLVLSSSAA